MKIKVKTMGKIGKGKGEEERRGKERKAVPTFFSAVKSHSKVIISTVYFYIVSEY